MTGKNPHPLQQTKYLFSALRRIRGKKWHILWDLLALLVPKGLIKWGKGVKLPGIIQIWVVDLVQKLEPEMVDSLCSISSGRKE